MTPFDTWYSANIAPMLEQTLVRIPPKAREPMRQASRESMAACWNAAVDATDEALAGFLEDASCEKATFVIEKLRVPVTP